MGRTSAILFGRGGLAVSALVSATALSAPVYAQTTSALEGHVDGATADMQVTAIDNRTGQRRGGTVDANGNYSIIGLVPSTYTVTVQGHESQVVTLLIGQTAAIDFTNEASAAAGDGKGDIIVTARTLREVRTATVSTNITPAQIENIPQSRRNFLSFAALAPGVNVTPGDTAQLQAGGVSSSQTNVLIDGMSLKNPINHGGIFGQNFGKGNPFPQSAIQEYKVDTQNFDARNGQVGSALVTALTKSGGNEFHGSAFIEFQPRSFITQPYFDKKAGTAKPEYNRKQFGGEFGGPIVKDKLFFYFAGEGTVEKLPGSTGKVVDAPDNITSLITVPRNSDFKQGLYFGKLTWLADDRNTINIEAFIRRENNPGDIAANAAATHGGTILTRQDRYQFNWTYNDGDGLLNQFNVAYDKSIQAALPVGAGPEYIISEGEGGFSTLAQLGANSFAQGDTVKSVTFKDDLTLRKGDHTIGAGFQIVAYDLSRTLSDHLNGSLFFSNTGPGTDIDVMTAQPYGAKVNIRSTPAMSGKNTQIGAYVQDEWRPDDHWTLSAGIRWDVETNALSNDYVTPANIVTALRNYQGWKAVGINPDDYISTGNERKIEWGAIQPRVSISYDVKGDRDLVIFGGIGRYFDRSLFIGGVIESLTNANNIPSVFFCSNGGASRGDGKGANESNCAQWNDSYRDVSALRALAQSQDLTGGSVSLLNNKTPLPFSDQIDFGIRKRLGPIQASLTFSHIRSHNIFQFVRANYYENGWYTRRVTRDANGNVTGCTDGGNAWIQDVIPGSLTNEDGSAVSPSVCAAQNGQLPGFNGKLNIGQSQGTADYNAIYLTLEKPFTDRSKWGFQTSLTISSARSNVAAELNSDEMFGGTSQDAYGWNYVNGAPKWNLFTTGLYRAPFGFVLSGTLTLNSGPSFGHVVFDNPPDGACCYGNFSGVHYPKPFIGYKRLDLRIAKTFKMPFAKSQELTIDFEVFNAFNWLNRTYSTWNAGNGANPPLIEDSQVAQDARSFQAGIKYKF